MEKVIDGGVIQASESKNADTFKLVTMALGENFAVLSLIHFVRELDMLVETAGAVVFAVLFYIDKDKHPIFTTVHPCQKERFHREKRKNHQ